MHNLVLFDFQQDTVGFQENLKVCAYTGTYSVNYSYKNTISII